MKYCRLKTTNFCFIVMINPVIIMVIYLTLLKYKYINNYMLIYVKILKSSNCIDILNADAYMPALHIL